MILVSGSSGLVGQSVVKMLHDRGFSWLKIPRMALLNQDDAFWDKLEEDPSISAIVHCAAVVPRPPSVPDSEDAAKKTRAMDKTVAFYAKKKRMPVIYFSGCALYCSQNIGECLETAPLQSPPLTSYLQAKAEGDEAFRRLNTGVVLRLPAPVGPGLSPFGVFGRFVQQALNGLTLEVWGSGTREQDFVDTRDVAEAVLTVLRSKSTGCFNIASGQPSTMLDLAQQIVQSIGSGIISVGTKPDPLEGKKSRYSIARARKVLGWRPAQDLKASIQAILDSLASVPDGT